MADDFNDLWVEEYMRDQELFMSDMKRLITLDVWSQLTQDTPFDTGRARASWVATSRRPSSYVPPEGGTSYGRTAPRVKRKTALKDSNYVVSNLVYMERLNEGHSQQQPAGFIDRAVSRSVGRIDRLVRRLIRKHDL